MTDDICEVCGEARAVHSHHRKLRSQGGEDEPANLLRVCAEDHAWIHANPSESYARGLLVHSWADPALVEVFGVRDVSDAIVDPIHEWNEIPSAEELLGVQPGETCERCKRRVPHPKKATSPTTKVWSTRVPIDDAETFSELVDAAAEHHGLSSRPHHRFWCLLYAVTLLLQQERGELPA